MIIDINMLITYNKEDNPCKSISLPPSWRSRRPPSQLLLILNPIVLITTGRIDHLGNDLIVGLQN